MCNTRHAIGMDKPWITVTINSYLSITQIRIGTQGLGLEHWLTHVRNNSQMLRLIDKWACRTSPSPWSCCPMINVCLNPDFYLYSLFPAGKYLHGQILILSRWFHHFVKSTCWIEKMIDLTNQCAILRLLKSSTLILLNFWTLNVITNPILGISFLLIMRNLQHYF